MKKNLFSFLTALAVFFALRTVAFAENRPNVVSATTFLSDKAPSAQQIASVERHLNISATLSRDAIRSAESVSLTDFPIAPMQQGTINLKRSRMVIDANTEVWEATANGSAVRIPAPEAHSFYGSIQGDEGSFVFLTFVNGDVYGHIRQSTGERFVIAPISTDYNDSREHILMDESALNKNKPKAEFTCLTEPEANFIVQEPRNKVLSQDLMQANFALELASDVYAKFGNDAVRELAYFTAMYALVSRVYEDEVDVSLYMSWVWIWKNGAEVDPYTQTKIETNINKVPDLQTEMKTYWQKNRTTVSRSFAQMCSLPPKSTGGQYVAGKSDFSLCNNSRSYSVVTIDGTYTYPTLAYTEDVGTAAHEIGHHFGGVHTHSCSWNPPLDTCVTSVSSSPYYAGDACFSITPIKRSGTIMSYCHLINGSVAMTFSSRVSSVLRATAEAAFCIDIPLSPKIVILDPVGGSRVATGTQVGIRWKSSQVASVAIEYSADGGSWNTIVGSVAATTEQYQWTIPTVNAKKMWIRVRSTSDATVADTSMSSIETVIPNIALTYPVGAEKIGQKESVQITWLADFIDNYTIEFSSNNGTNWETVTSNITAKTYAWTAPQIVTSQALIRVKNSDGKIFSQSQPFKIGAPVFQLLAPNGGEKWVIGTKQLVRWSAEFVKSIRLQYSVNNGAAWKTLKLATDGTTGQYEWTVPNDPTEQALVRVMNVTDLTGNPLAVSAGVFAIGATVGVADNQEQAEFSVKVSPQPASDVALIEWNLPAISPKLTISLQDITGKSVGESLTFGETSGAQLRRLDVSHLPQGVYFVVLTAGERRAVKPMIIIR